MASFRTLTTAAAGVMVLASSAMGFALGAMPLETAAELGASFSPAPTQAPSIELVKKKLAKKALTNVCTEWTIPGGYGQPQCRNSETCLFKTATDGYFYEGCGQTSIAYDWVTACYNYPQSGSEPVSEIFCPKTAPICGYYAFVFNTDATFWNFGCSTSSYGFLVQLVSTLTGGSSSTVVLNGGASGSATATGSQTVVTQTRLTSTSTYTPPTTRTTTVGAGGASSTSTSTTTIGSHSSSKTPIGAIVGGVVGGLAVIGGLIILLVWFCVRKRRQAREKAAAHVAQVQQQQADLATAVAFQNNQRISEIGGSNVKPFVGAYAPQNGPEKQNPVVGAIPVQQQNGNVNGAYAENLHANTQSPPPPMYAQPQPQPSPVPSPYQNYSELATPNGMERPISVPPVSPMGTMTSASSAPQHQQIYQQPYQQPLEMVGENRQSLPTPQQAYPPFPPPQQQHAYAQPTELVGESRQSSPAPPQQQIYTAYAPPQTQPTPQPTQLGGENRQPSPTPQQQVYAAYVPPQPQPTELGGENRGSWQVPSGVQEIGAGAAARTPRPPQGPPPGFVPQQQNVQPQEPVAEMSATAASRNPRPPPGPPPGHHSAVDMSGAPMSEEWNGHHELE